MQPSQRRRRPWSRPLRWLLLPCLTLAHADSETVVFSLVPRATIEAHLRDYTGSNLERGARLKRLFVDAGCGDHVSEQTVSRLSPPNVICTLPGNTDRTIVVGAHFDRVRESAGVADNWSGAALLPSLYAAVKDDPRHHTYVFIGFTDEEKGLIGSRFYVRKLSRQQIALTAAMINLDTLGLAPTEIWTHRSDAQLMRALLGTAHYLEKPVTGVNFERVGSSDSESFASKKIPRITIHSLTQKSEDEGILHSKKDQLGAIDLDHYYDTYHLMAVYLAYLDLFLRGPDPAAAGRPTGSP